MVYLVEDGIKTRKGKKRSGKNKKGGNKGGKDKELEVTDRAERPWEGKAMEYSIEDGRNLRKDVKRSRNKYRCDKGGKDKE